MTDHDETLKPFGRTRGGGIQRSKDLRTPVSDRLGGQGGEHGAVDLVEQMQEVPTGLRHQRRRNLRRRGRSVSMLRGMRGACPCGRASSVMAIAPVLMRLVVGRFDPHCKRDACFASTRRTRLWRPAVPSTMPAGPCPAVMHTTIGSVIAMKSSARRCALGFGRTIRSRDLHGKLPQRCRRGVSREAEGVDQGTRLGLGLGQGR